MAEGKVLPDVGETVLVCGHMPQRFRYWYRNDAPTQVTGPGGVLLTFQFYEICRACHLACNGDPMPFIRGHVTWTQADADGVVGLKEPS